MRAKPSTRSPARTGAEDPSSAASRSLRITTPGTKDTKLNGAPNTEVSSQRWTATGTGTSVSASARTTVNSRFTSLAEGATTPNGGRLRTQEAEGVDTR